MMSRPRPVKFTLNPTASCSHQTPETKDSYEEDSWGPWSRLPEVVLCHIMAMLRNEDVISIGQTCRSWRSAARQDHVWTKRTIEYRLAEKDRRLHPSYRINGALGRHLNAQHFSRTVRFAPCLAMIRCNDGMRPSARAAIFKDSNCKPRGLEINGGLKSALKYILRWSDFLEDLTLLNPSIECLKAITLLPCLTTLTIRQGVDWRNEYVTPDFPLHECAPSISLRKLTFHRMVCESAVNALIQAHVTVLENLVVYVPSCVPQAVAECVALQCLTVDLDPTGDDGQKLQDLLRKKNERALSPLRQLTMMSLGVHDNKACVKYVCALRANGFLTTDAAVKCKSCERGEAIHPDLHRLHRARLWDY